MLRAHSLTFIRQKKSASIAPDVDVDDDDDQHDVDVGDLLFSFLLSPRGGDE